MPTQPRKIALFDVDYTLHPGYLCSGLNVYATENGLAAAEVLNFERQLIEQLNNHVIDYREASRRAIVMTAKILKGRSVLEAETICDNYVCNHVQMFTWVKSVFSFLKKNDYEIILISGAITPLVRSFAKKAGVKKYYGSDMSIRGEIYTGIVDPILNFEVKNKLLQKIRLQFNNSYIIAFGDSEGDLDMLTSVHKGFLFEPRTEELKQQASKLKLAVVTSKTIIGAVKALV